MANGYSVIFYLVLICVNPSSSASNCRLQFKKGATGPIGSYYGPSIISAVQRVSTSEHLLAFAAAPEDRDALDAFIMRK